MCYVFTLTQTSLKRDFSTLQAESHTGQMQGRTSYFCHSTPRGRLKWAGFLSEQEEKRFNQYYHPGQGRNNRGGDQYGGDIFFNEGDNCVVSYEEEPKEGVSNARIHSDATEGQEMPSHKRLLVVANRLPVSVIRKDDESWQLELNVGGLVSALLGEYLPSVYLVSSFDKLVLRNSTSR